MSEVIVIRENGTYDIKEPKDKLNSLYYPSGNKFDSSCFDSPFANGYCGFIYPHKEEPIALKVYTYGCPSRFHIQKQMFDKFVSANIPNTVRLHDCLFGPNDLFNQVEGYTMDLITGEKICIFDLNFDDFSFIATQLEETLRALSEEKIIIRDMNDSNILFFDRSVCVIDLDCFYTSHHSKGYIYAINKRRLLKCLNNILKYQCYDKTRTLYSPILSNFVFSSFPDCVNNSLNGSSPKEFVIEKIMTHKK